MLSKTFLWLLAVLMIAKNVKVHSHIKEDFPYRTTDQYNEYEEYNEKRYKFLQDEKAKYLGADVELTGNEWEANKIIMNVKSTEYNKGLVTPHLFVPSHHLFEVLKEIRKSRLFEYISRMPKGGVLHAHDTALCNTDYLITLTYRDHLWVCLTNTKPVRLLFSKLKPASILNGQCTWHLLSELREKRGKQIVDNNLKAHLTLYPRKKFKDNNAAWGKFGQIFALVNGLLFFAPVWGDYYYNALKEFHADGVQYLEFRSTVPILYDLEGTNYTAIDTVRIYKENLDKFMKDYPDFIGSKMIYAPLRNVNTEEFNEYIRICSEIKERYPDFLAGFDLVGQEELGRPLRYFVPKLLNMSKTIDFFFHAGETNWLGSTVDENLIDAVLLGTKRIGHGFALNKHPSVLAALKQKNIAVEVNPISNQVLQLVADYRNHPCAHLFADNYTVVISSDDPSFWKATPLSHDFYIAFLGIASAHSDLRFLKKLAQNSIEYSAMSTEQKKEAFKKWQTKWDSYINNLVAAESRTTYPPSFIKNSFEI